MKSTQVTITDLAHAFGMGRDTVSRRLADAKVLPSGTRRSHSTFAFRDCVPALLGVPEFAQLDPFRQKAKLQSEQIAARIEIARGDLVVADDVKQTFACISGPIRHALSALPNLLWRDAALTPEQLARCRQLINALLEDMDELMGGEIR